MMAFKGLSAILLVLVVTCCQSRRWTARERAMQAGDNEFQGGVVSVARRHELPEPRLDVEKSPVFPPQTNHSQNTTVTKNKPTQKRRHKKRRGGKGKKKRLENKARENDWFFCDNEEDPTSVAQVLQGKRHRGVMCSKEYPWHTCCPHQDITTELVGAQMVEKISNVRCAKLLMQLRCARCSPRSWWLFHAPDKLRLPHRRMLPILCPDFCRKFQKACRQSVAGLQAANYCDYHTTAESGPCFPDYEIIKGTID